MGRASEGNRCCPPGADRVGGVIAQVTAHAEDSWHVSGYTAAAAAPDRVAVLQIRTGPVTVRCHDRVTVETIHPDLAGPRPATSGCCGPDNVTRSPPLTAATPVPPGPLPPTGAPGGRGHCPHPRRVHNPAAAGGSDRPFGPGPSRTGQPPDTDSQRTQGPETAA